MKNHKPPFVLNEIKLEVTHACLLRCVHCSSFAGQAGMPQMEWNDCKRILSEASLIGVKEVAFSGGEPLLWKSLPLAIAYASANGMVVSLYSTGNTPTALDSFGNLKDVGLSRIIFSLFGNTKEGHEKITLVDGSFQSTMRAVRQCVSLDLHVEFHFVPTSVNYRDLRAVAELARELGVKRVSVLRLVPQGRATAHENLKLNSDENKALRQMITDLINEGHDMRVGSPFNILMIRENPECCSGIDRLTISPDLKIAPCDAFKQISPEMLGVSGKYSSLADYSLADCWEKSLYLQRIREYLVTPFAEECGQCSMLRKCLSGCLAQKYYVHGELAKRRDPMCLCNDLGIYG